jgi:O-methyltransferase involved in polyketide biosynthesis
MGFEKISLTAKLTAYMRQFSDVPFAKDVAQAIGAQQAIEELLRAHDLGPEELLWYAPIFEARYKSIAARLRASGMDQILELASGLSLRGLAMTEAHPGLTYVETDLPALNDEKRSLVTHVRLQHHLPDRPGYLLRTANALELGQLRDATETCDRARPLAVVTEGLLQYLSPAELEGVAANIRSLLAAFGPGGLWITPDFSFQDQVGPLSERQRRFRAVVSAATERQMYDSAFADQAAFEVFLSRFGMDAQSLHQLDEAGDLTSPARLGLAPATLERLRPRLRLWVLRLTA